MNMDTKQLTTTDYEKVQVYCPTFLQVCIPVNQMTIYLICSSRMFQMIMPEINSDLIEKLLKELKPSKSPGQDGIHPRVLKELASELAIPLTKIFKSIIDTGRIPRSWKIAHMTPIFKKR